MHWVYILKSKSNGSLYIGSTNNLVRRLREHNAGQSFSTARYKPWKFVYIEGYALRDDALRREEVLKQFGKVYAHLKRRIQRSLQGS